MLEAILFLAAGIWGYADTKVPAWLLVGVVGLLRLVHVT